MEGMVFGSAVSEVEELAHQSLGETLNKSFNDSLIPAGKKDSEGEEII